MDSKITDANNCNIKCDNDKNCTGYMFDIGGNECFVYEGTVGAGIYGGPGITCYKKTQPATSYSVIPNGVQCGGYSRKIRYDNITANTCKDTCDRDTNCTGYMYETGINECNVYEGAI